MAVEYEKAPESVLHMAEELIGKYHITLKGADLAFVFKVGADAGPYGRASKVTAVQRPYFDYDFLIWIDADHWAVFTTEQRMALVDHLLCHCRITVASGEPRAKLMQPDLVEFRDVIERHGLWNRELFRSKSALDGAVQLEIPELAGGGLLDNPDPEKVPE